MDSVTLIRPKGRHAEGWTRGARYKTFLYLLAVAASAIGLILAYSSAKTSTDSSRYSKFWIAFFIGLIATTMAATGRGVSNRKRILVLVVFGVLTYVPKFMMSPDAPAYYDEFGHYRRALDLANGGGLFAPASYLPITRDYPLLSVLTALVHRLGLSVWHAGVLVILLAHVATVVLIYYLARRLKLSERASALAAVVFALNPSFLFFDAQYSYESLGIALLLGSVVLLVSCATAETRNSTYAFGAGSFVLAVATTTTHHISTFVLLALLAGLSACAAWSTAKTGSGRRRVAPLIVFILATIFALTWTLLVASTVGDYLGPHIARGFRQVQGLVSGGGTPPTVTPAGAVVQTTRTVFGGSGIPYYENVASYTTVVLVLLAALFGAAVWWRGRRTSDISSRLQLPLIGIGLLYFASLPFALTVGGNESAHRAWEFCYIGMAILIGLAVPSLKALSGRLRLPFTPVALVSLCVVAMGNVAAGSSEHYRFPGPPVFGIDNRVPTAASDELIDWVNRNTRPGTRVVTDRWSKGLMAAYTHLDVPAFKDGGVFTLYREGGNLSPPLVRALKRSNFSLFILDKRILTQFPRQKLYPSYVGPESVNAPNLVRMTEFGKFRLLFENDIYVVYQLTA